MGLDWDNRTCLQKFSLIVSIITCCVAGVCLIANIIVTVQATNETWFTRCSDCKSQGGDEDCEKCCTKCTWRDSFYFYTLRAYSMLFLILTIAVEFPMITFLRKLLMLFKYYWGRGLLHVFVGFLTLIGNIAPDDPDAALMVAAVGWVMIGVGVVHFILTCVCFKDYSDLDEDEKAKQAEENRKATLAALPPAPPAQQMQPVGPVGMHQAPPPQYGYGQQNGGSKVYQENDYNNGGGQNGKGGYAI